MKLIASTVLALATALVAYAGDSDQSIGIDVYTHTEKEVAQEQKKQAEVWGGEDASTAYYEHNHELKGHADDIAYLEQVAEFYAKKRDLTDEQFGVYGGAFVYRLQKMLKIEAEHPDAAPISERTPPPARTQTPTQVTQSSVAVEPPAVQAPSVAAEPATIVISSPSALLGRIMQNPDEQLSRAWSNLEPSQRTALRDEERAWIKRNNAITDKHERYLDTARRAAYIWTFVKDQNLARF